MTARRSIAWRDYHVAEARHGGWKVRHRKFGIETTATLGGRVALVTWPTSEDAIADIEASYRDPDIPSTPPPHLEVRRMTIPTAWAFVDRAEAETPYAPIPDGARVHIDSPLLGLSQWGTVRGGPVAGYAPGVVVHAVQTDTGPPVLVLRSHLTAVSRPRPHARRREPTTFHLPPPRML